MFREKIRRNNKRKKEVILKINTMKSEYLITTDKYKSDIGKIRSLPQESDTEKRYKHEKAMEFRMEVMLDNAKIMKVAFESICENPRQTKEELIEKIKQKTLYIAHPEMVSIFVKKIVKNIETIKKFLNGDFVTASDIFKALSNNRKPSGLVYLDTKNTLVPILYITK